MNTETGNVKNILLVEDDSRDVELTLTALQEKNLAGRVVVARDGAEALDYLYCRGKFKDRAGGHPAIVLLDNKMPKVSGLEVLKIIRADEHLKTIPVVVLSSSREAEDLVRFYKHGVNGYVVKPFDFKDYVKAVQQLGTFWATLNEPPPASSGGEAGVQNTGALLPEKEESKNEIPAQNAALQSK